MEDPERYWNGASAQRWLAAEARLERMLAPVGDAVLARAAIAPGERVIDVGCGTGPTTRAIAAAVGPTGTVVGVDLSEPMIERARELARGVATIEFALADATTAQLAPADLLLSRFGVMFFSDPDRAFANMHGWLRPGGRLVFACWRAPADNPWASVPYAAASACLDVPLPPLDGFGPGPFGFADRDRVRRIVEGAGFSNLAIDACDLELELGDSVDDALRFVLTSGPSARALADAPADVLARARTAIAGVLQPYATPAVRIPGAIWLVTAAAGRGGPSASSTPPR